MRRVANFGLEDPAARDLGRDLARAEAVPGQPGGAHEVVLQSDARGRVEDEHAPLAHGLLVEAQMVSQLAGQGARGHES